MRGYGVQHHDLESAVADLVPPGWDCSVFWCFIAEDGYFTNVDTGHRYYRMRLNTPRGTEPFLRRYMTLTVDPESSTSDATAFGVARTELRNGLREMVEEMSAAGAAT